MSSESRGYLAVALALAGALALTPLVRALARRAGKVSRPRADRWSSRPTALLGGLAMFIPVAAASLLVLTEVPGGWLVLSASTVLFLVGLVDDLRPLRPYQKLLGQIAGGVLLLLGGQSLPWTPWELLNKAVTLFWLVGITNALNLLDNMDGLAAGVAALASGFLAALFFTSGQPAAGFLLATFCAGVLGFLVYNFNPASIFMGDSGSLFLGFFLAATAVLYDAEAGRSGNMLAVWAVPVLLLSLPIFDTTFVTVMRKWAGRPASQGGRDHTSHRLVALGLSERVAVGCLHGLVVVSGSLALAVQHSRTEVSLALIVLFAVLLLVLGVRLARVRVYEARAVAKADNQQRKSM
jgi:UDP-GlcNAc:undecaprenyl-phosphate/decaprenyl-phosphate GlcNAc-1-phosphate transferase